MKKLILHIGTHKTGSTSIQNYLKSNRAKLIGKGWGLFDSEKFLSVSSPGSANSWVMFSGSRQNFTATIDSRFYDEISKIDGNVIASCEEISWMFNPEEINALKENLDKIFDEITLVIYFRRQDQFLVSHYQQGFRTSHSTAAMFYGRELMPIPKYEPYMDKYLDYHVFYSRWADVFGGENIRTNWFSKSHLVDGDVVSDFIEQTGVATEHSLAKMTNESLSKQDIVLRYFTLGTPLELVFDSQGTFNTNEKYSPSVGEMNEILSRYHDSNVELCNVTGLILPYEIHKVGSYDSNKMVDSDYISVINVLIDYISSSYLFKVYFVYLRLKKKMLNVYSFIKNR